MEGADIVFHINVGERGCMYVHGPGWKFLKSCLKFVWVKFLFHIWHTTGLQYNYIRDTKAVLIKVFTAGPSSQRMEYVPLFFPLFIMLLTHLSTLTYRLSVKKP